jgi:hypothetical protein
MATLHVTCRLDVYWMSTVLWKAGDSHSVLGGVGVSRSLSLSLSLSRLSEELLLLASIIGKYSFSAWELYKNSVSVEVHLDSLIIYTEMPKTSWKHVLVIFGLPILLCKYIPLFFNLYRQTQHSIASSFYRRLTTRLGRTRWPSAGNNTMENYFSEL